MKNDFEGDLIFSVIKNHLFKEGDLDPLKIQNKLASENIGMDLGVIKIRIDEFKKSKIYSDYKPKN